MFKDKSVKLFIILAGFFLTNAIIAEFIGIKIFSLEATFGFTPMKISMLGEQDLGFNLTAGVLLWPIVFIMTDVINEYYGMKGVRMLSFLAVAMIVYAFIMVYLAIQIVPNTWWDLESGIRDQPDQSIHSMNLAFRRIFGQGLWIIVGSLVAFLIGQLLDVLVFHKIKRFTGEKKVWLRATGSTLVSQFVDSYVVLFIAFYIGQEWSLGRVAAIANMNYIYKFFMAILLTPLIYLAHYIIDLYLGHEQATEMRAQATK